MKRAGLFSLILLVLGFAGLAAVTGGRWEQYSQHWYAVPSLPRPGRSEPDQIRRAVHADGNIWVLAGGEVWVVDQAAATARRTGMTAYDICTNRGALIAVTQDPHRAGRLVVARRTSEGWTTIASLDPRGAGLVALECSSVVRLLTSDRLMTLGSAPKEIALSSRIPAWPNNAILATADHLLVGINAGEWGGAIWRIDPDTGLVEQLGRTKANAAPCAAPLEIACSPVNGFVAHPWRKGCSIAAVGSIRDAEGGLLEICGTFVHPLTAPITSRAAGGGNVAYFGLAATKRGVLANTVAGLRNLQADGALSPEEQPRFANDGPFQVSRQEGFVLVRAASDQRFHPGGSNALLVPLAAATAN